MRRLAQPVVLKSAAIAALVTTLACYPRFTLWLNRSAPVWYLEIMTFLCSMVLWGFVFAWHEYYTRRPLWVFKPELRVVLTATLLAVGAAVISHRFIDPLLRARLPEEYPGDLRQWVASVLFGTLIHRRPSYQRVQDSRRVRVRRLQSTHASSFRWSHAV